ncbi:DUF1801 domain-containing protein [Sphingobacterium oryzagri]|uniref:DUF1801 domain-containing protein n=1 Tax=Sphingobacterium oryzagri TaxID=3025669 RepID=A0ABY7WPC5_9SPHI|nr:DUF1801 domain-containing protein [Sphingobacterium sp. KACC 22765]WDF70273.1 DUF1801 domain-containing protein [Sphingobacterium sp. KACC 22765]
MATNKTTFNEQPVADFIEALDNPQQKADSLALIELMEAVSGEKATMFGPNIIAFGKYAYTYASGHSGEAPLLAFSPRKNALSLYVYTGLEAHQSFLEGLGKYKMGKACIYVKKLTDIDLDVLQRLMQHTLDFVSQTYTRVRP